MYAFFLPNENVINCNSNNQYLAFSRRKFFKNLKMSKQKRKSKKYFVKVSGILCAVICGFLLAYSLFSILQKHFKASFQVSLLITLLVVISSLLLISLHKPSRCVFFLLIPQFFSSKGRTTLVAYMMLLSLAGPGKNLIKNVHVMTRCLACGQVRISSNGCCHSSFLPNRCRINLNWLSMT